MKRLPTQIILSSLILGLVFDLFFYGKVPGLSVFLFTCLLLGSVFYFSRQFKRPLNPSMFWLVPAILFFSFMVFVRANPFLIVMDIGLVFYLLLMVVRALHQPHIPLHRFGLFQYVSIAFRLPFRIVREAMRFGLQLLNNRQTAAANKSAAPLLRGILLSLPVLVLFLILLSSADLVFKEYIGSLLTPKLSAEAIFRCGLIGFVASFLAGSYALILMPSSRIETDSAPAEKTFAIGFTEAAIILGSVSLLFLAFVIIQLAYLFGGAEQIASTGYTYAEYARKGFFELIAVAAISYVLLIAVKKVTAFRSDPHAMMFKWLGGVLIAEVMVIMLSAHMRLNLYEEAYGFTTLRLLSHMFIVWLALAFVLLHRHLVKETRDHDFAFQLFVSAMIFIAVINLINPDNFIARKNISRLNSVGKLDLYYLSSLSEDATPTIARLLDHPNEKVRANAASVLNWQQRSSTSSSKHWQSTNLSRRQAKDVFAEKAALIDAAKSYPDIKDLEIK